MTTDISSFAPPQIEELRRRAGSVCVVFDAYRLPMGTHPDQGRVGIEQEDQHWLLHVDRKVNYRGDDAEVRDWIASGTLAFEAFDQLVEWLGRHGAAGRT